jgi:hypothetical protein
MFPHHHESRKLSIKIEDYDEERPKNGLKPTKRRAKWCTGRRESCHVSQD